MTCRCLVVVALLCGCTSYSTRFGATPLAPRESVIGLAVDTLIVERGRRYQALPLPEVSYRRGIRDGWDVGGRINLTSTEGSARIRLWTTKRLHVAWAPSLGVGYEPVTNNTTDLVFLRAGSRLLIEARAKAGWSAVFGGYPSLTFTGPLTMFQGVSGDAARWVVRPGFLAAVRIPRHHRAFWLEVSAHPPYVLGEGWGRPAIQFGIAVLL